jgi:hypothetical protein
MADKDNKNSLLIFGSRHRIMATVGYRPRDSLEVYMRKLLFVMLAIALAAPAFAGDALVLPGGVGRVYVVPVYGMDGGSWVGSDYQKTEDNDFTLEKLFNLGGAIEYGVTDAISFGLQWAPGINLIAPLNSEDNTEAFEAGLGGLGPTYGGEPLALGADGSVVQAPITTADVTAEGISPLAIGAEIQIVGPQGFVKADPEVVRVSVTPGMEVPFPEPDWKAHGKAYADGDAYVDPLVYAGGLSPRWAVGAQFDFDVVPHELFYLNLGFEYKYRFARTFDGTAFYEEAGVFVTDAATFGEGVSGGDVKSVEYEAGQFNEFTVDLEPDFRLPFDGPLSVNVSVPTTLAITSSFDVDAEYEVDTTNVGTVEGKAKPAQTSDTGYLLTMGPSVNLFFTGLPVPVQLVGTWNFPLTGNDAAQRQTGVLEARVYFSTN